MRLMHEFFLFLKKEKKWWLLPMVLVLVILGTLLVLAQGAAIAPFIYTIFWAGIRATRSAARGNVRFVKRPRGPHDPAPGQHARRAREWVRPRPPRRRPGT